MITKKHVQQQKIAITKEACKAIKEKQLKNEKCSIVTIAKKNPQ